MHQPKQNSTHAPESLPQSTEATAIKFLRPLSSKNNIAQGGPTDKDGTEGGGSDVESFIVDVADNGFLLTVNYLDGLQEKTVHQHFDEVLEVMKVKL